MARRGKGSDEFPWGPVAALIVAVVVFNYKTRHPRCKNCGLILTALKLYEQIECPTCGTVLDGLEAALS
jgi:hypothetical protein